MAERKSDYTGDVFGDWLVNGRVEVREDWMIKGKRYWAVQNDVTGESRVVEQTALKNLPKEDVVAPVALVANGSNLGWATDLPTISHDQVLEIFGLTREDLDDDLDFHVGEAPEIAFSGGAVPTGHDGKRNADGKIPGNDKGEQNLAPDWAEKAAALHVGPKLDGPNPNRHPVTEPLTANVPGKLRTTEQLVDWATTLPEDNTVTRFGGLGEAAEETVTEAELDERVPAPDPIRKAVRLLMGELFTARQQRDLLVEQVEQLGIQFDGLTQLVDDLLKLVITS